MAHGDGGESTNLHVTHVPADEDAVGDYFSQWGDVGAVHVGRAGVFVAFMTRADAEAALRGADGALWASAPLRVEWARPVRLPAGARYKRRRAASREESPMPVRRRSMRPQFDEPSGSFDDGAAVLYSTDSEEAEQMHGGAPPPLARRRLESMLRGLTPRRERIARCMALAIDHAYAADDVADVLVRSLTVWSTPIPRKIARLHVVSDILYNAAAPVPNAWRYRGAFEQRLAPAFAHLGTLVGALPGRLSTESVARQLGRVLDCWDAWLVLSPSAIAAYRESLGAIHR